MGLSSSDAWSRGSDGILSTSLGFAKCFRKPLFIFQVIFIAWRSFHSHLKPKGDFVAKSHFRSQGAFSQTISQPMEKIETFSQPILKLRGDFAAISKLGDDFTAKWHFRRPFRSLTVISQPRAILAAAKISVRGFEIDLRNGGRFAKTPCKANGSC